MLIDEIVVTFKAGKGGNGKVSFFPGKKGRPNGGDGGRGGNVIIQAKKDYDSLSHLGTKRIFQAENGSDGDSYRRTGKEGKHIIVNVPCNTDCHDLATNKTITLSRHNDSIIICYGGKGGRGNEFFKSPIHRGPRHAEPGVKGQNKTCRLILKLIADIGLVGLPNAGKSSLLNCLTKANAKTAPYPFTTIEPNLGTLGTVIIADIPGLIEGASIGKGLGHSFLKHIEKVAVILHMISSDSPDVYKDYQTISKELMDYNPQLLNKKELILLSKTDLVAQKTVRANIKKLKALGKNIVPISIHDRLSLKVLIEAIQKMLPEKKTQHYE